MRNGLHMLIRGVTFCNRRSRQFVKVAICGLTFGSAEIFNPDGISPDTSTREDTGVVTEIRSDRLGVDHSHFTHEEGCAPACASRVRGDHEADLCAAHGNCDCTERLQPGGVADWCCEINYGDTHQISHDEAQHRPDKSAMLRFDEQEQPNKASVPVRDRQPTKQKVTKFKTFENFVENKSFTSVGSNVDLSGRSKGSNLSEQLLEEKRREQQGKLARFQAQQDAEMEQHQKRVSEFIEVTEEQEECKCNLTVHQVICWVDAAPAGPPDLHSYTPHLM